jgi:hypothetical protein
MKKSQQDFKEADKKKDEALKLLQQTLQDTKQKLEVNFFSENSENFQGIQ